ncbi:MAG: hypothetical protein RL141_1151 [Candidatus Parcubacteria bacterium]|jgi:hypothetical protein
MFLYLGGYLLHADHEYLRDDVYLKKSTPTAFMGVGVTRTAFQELDILEDVFFPI